MSNLDYGLVKCNRCDLKSVGVFYDRNDSEDGWNKTFLCNKHWYARKSVEDKEQEAQEMRQWGDKQWYRDAFPEKFNQLDNALTEQYRRKKASQSQQMSLL